MGEKTIDTTSSFNFCQQSSSSRCSAEAWKRHSRRTSVCRSLTTHRLLLLLLTAVISCTGWCYFVRVFTVVASIPLETSSLLSATRPAHQPGTDVHEEGIRTSSPLAGRKRIPAEKEDETWSKSESSEGDSASKTTSNREAYAREEQRLRKNRPSSGDESVSRAVERKELDKEAGKSFLGQFTTPEGERKQVRKRGFISPDDFREKRQELTSVGEVEGSGEPEEKSRLRGEKETKEKEEETGVAKETEKEKVLSEGQKEEQSEEKKDETSKAENREWPVGVHTESRETVHAVEEAVPSSLTKEINSYYKHQQLCTPDDSLWCEGQFEEEEGNLFSSIQNTLRTTDDFLSSIFTRPLFSFPFHVSHSFVGPTSVERSGPCRFTFTLDGMVPLDQARLYVTPSQHLVGLAADRRTKRSRNCKTFHEMYGERTQSLAVAVVPKMCMISDKLLETGLIAWSCAGKTATGSKKILVSFPSEAHAKTLTADDQLCQEACDVLLQKGDFSSLTPREKCVLSGRTVSECDLLKAKAAEEKDAKEGPSFSSVGYGDKEVRLSRFKYA